MRQVGQSGQDEAMGTACEVARMLQRLQRFTKMMMMMMMMMMMLLNMKSVVKSHEVCNF